MIDSVDAELKQILEEGITETELEKARNQVSLPKSAVVTGSKSLPSQQFVWIDARNLVSLQEET